MRPLFVSCSLAALIAPLLATTQPEAKPQAAPPPALSISGVGIQPLSLTTTDLAALDHTKLSITEHEGEENTYEGVSVQVLLTKAGMAFGQSLRGPRLRDFVLAESPDKFGVVFALPEISEEFSQRRIIVADKVNGGLITGRDGPLRIIVSDEVKHARWVRNVTSITVRSSTSDAPIK